MATPSFEIGNEKIKEVYAKKVRFLLNGFNWFHRSCKQESQDLASLDMDHFGECQRVKIIAENQMDNLSLHMHIPKSAGINKTHGAALLIYFCNNEESFFSCTQEDRNAFFNTEGRKFIRDEVYVLSIKESEPTSVDKTINEDLMKRIFSEVKNWFKNEVIVVAGYSKGAYFAMKSLMDHKYTKNIVLADPYINDVLKDNWTEYLKKDASLTFLVNTSESKDHYETIVKNMNEPINKVYDNKEELYKALGDQISWMPDIGEGSCIGLLYFRYREFLERCDKDKLDLIEREYDQNVATHIKASPTIGENNS